MANDGLPQANILRFKPFYRRTVMLTGIIAHLYTFSQHEMYIKLSMQHMHSLKACNDNKLMKAFSNIFSNSENNLLTLRGVLTESE